MGNCQAIDTAALVIQHPSGKEDTLCYPVTASYVMKMNPGHYVALLISTTTLSLPSVPKGGVGGFSDGPVRMTRIKLLRATDTLVPGQVYRLLTTQEVTKGLWAKKCAKMKKTQTRRCVEVEKENEMKKKQEKERGRICRSWQPSLQSITEGSSREDIF